MQIRRLAAIMFIICGLVFSGCKTCMDSNGGPARTQSAGEASASLAPENFKEERLAEAMRGLRYDSEGVEVDESMAAQIPNRGDADAAEEAYLQGREMLFQVNDRVAAISAFTRAVILIPDVPRYYAGLGQALRYKGKMQEALAAFRTALALDPEYFEARRQFAVAVQMTGKYEEALSAWERVIDLDPEFGEAHGRLAILSYYMADYIEAWQHVHRAERLEYDLPSQFRSLLEAKMPEPAHFAAGKGL